MADALSALRLVTAALFIIFTTVFLRATYILTLISRQRQHPPKKTGKSHMIIVLGSGGHTAEMMSLLRDTDVTRYFHRTYIVSSGDAFSASKASEIERSLQKTWRDSPTEKGQVDETTGVWEVKVVPRARKIHQPLYTTPFSALWSILCCIWVLVESAKSSRVEKGRYPDVIITNGPATAVMVIFAAAILKFFGVAGMDRMKSVYVESWARVKTLSLSGKILLRTGICDKFLVQWEGLARRLNGDGKRQRVDWVGFLVA